MRRAELRPGPAEREALRAKEVLEELRRRTERSVCHLTVSQTPVTIFDSHIGGLPYCPRDGVPPVGEDGRQLRLMAQINFAQMPSMPPFPERGILQFFLPDHDPLVGYRGMEHWTEQKDWRVVYYPELDDSVTEDEVRGKVTVGPAVVEEGRERRLNSGIFLDNIVHKLHFAPAEREGMTVCDYRFDSRFDAVYRELFPNEPPVEFCPDRPPVRPVPVDWMRADRLWGELYGGACGRRSKLGGWPGFPKADPRRVLPEAAGEACPWDTVLLQFDSLFLEVDDPRQWLYPVSFGEEGRVIFLIREEDLLRRDFSRVGYYWQDNSDAAYFKQLCGEEWRPSARLAFSPI